MLEYLKHKLSKLKINDDDICGYPRYYKEKGKTIKELANGEKWIVKLDDNYREVMIERIK